MYILSSSWKPSGRFVYVSFVDDIQHLLSGFRRYLFLWFPSWQENVCLWFPSFCFMVSVVAGKRFLMVSVAGFLVDSAAAEGSNILECMKRFFVFCCVFRTGFRRLFFMVSVTFCL